MTGIPLIRKLNQEFQDLIILPGGGINETNLQQILEETNVTEFHGSARSVQESRMQFKNEKCKMGTDSSDYSIQVTSVKKVEQMVRIFQEYINK